MNLGKRIAYYRKGKNITQESLAKQLGISNQAVSKWETGQSYPDVELLPRIADIFGITLDELFERKGLLNEPQSIVNSVTETESVTKPQQIISSAEATTTHPPLYAALPWENDEKLRVVLFQGHTLIQTDELKKRFGKICKEITFHYSGPALNVESCFSVSCEEISGWVTAGSYVECENVGNWVTAGSYVECENVGQYVTAGSYVECEDVGQNVTAGSYVECGDVGGNVSAGSNATCGDVTQNVTAGNNVECGDVGSDVSAEGNVTCGDVTQNVTAGSYVECGDVGGDVSAEGNVTCGDVSGNVNANGKIDWEK